MIHNKIIYGDCRQSLKELHAQNVKVQMCVTSPPYYGLRNYGDESNQIGQEDTPEKYIQEMVDVFEDVKNILHDDGVLFLNIGDSYYNYRPGKGQGLVKQSVSKTKQDLPDKCARRGNKLDGLKEKDLIGIPWMLAFALRSNGWYLRQDIIWHKPNPMPESVKDRCTKSHEYLFLLTKNKHYYFDNESIKEPAKDWGTRDRSKGKYHNPGSGLSPHTGLNKSYAKKNKRSVWSVTNKPSKMKKHFAVYPPDLIEPCIKAGSKEGDIILDPFLGSGTTARVAQSLNRHYIGCELHKEYVQ